MDRKYQIFVSSTYEDKDERSEVNKACLKMGHIPVATAYCFFRRD